MDWEHKQLQFQHDEHWIELTGVQPQLTNVAQISVAQLHALEEQHAVAHMVLLCSMTTTSEPGEQTDEHPAVTALLEEFHLVFAEPTTLPKHRAWDHRIQLLEGTKPVNIRPYRYTPEQKSEIEKQVMEMLKQGLIVPSVSPFSSPVLLVKKKDQTWRFCVDFRHLNAITVKSCFPLPIIDELLDELAGSHWFSKLDLRAGYHQIRLVEQDEEKTAFKTHQGHFQFRVLPYGVTGGPSTFQSAMNIVMSPLLRRGVLVFMDDILVHSDTFEKHLDLLREVLQLLADKELVAKRSKCSFAKNQIAYRDIRLVEMVWPH